MENFVSLMEKRYSCRNFKVSELSEAEKTLILESGRLTPCSFGLETTRMHVCPNSLNHEGIVKACFDQNSVKTSPFVVVLTTITEDVNPDGAYAKRCFSRFDGPLSYFIEDFRPHYEMLKAKGEISQWLKRQAFLCAANMMTAAVSVGIQSCAIEGFDPKLIKEAIDLGGQEPALVIAFGYPDDKIRAKVRFPLADLVTFH